MQYVPATVDVVIPALNEEASLPRVLADLAALGAQAQGSTQGGVRRANQMRARFSTPAVRLVFSRE